MSSTIVFGLLIPLSSAGQFVQRRATTWVALKTGDVFKLKQWEVKEEIHGLTRNDYIKRKADKKWTLFYRHERAVVVTLGHRGNLVLINDNEASKSNKVVVVNLDTTETKQVDLQAITTYKRNGSSDGPMMIVPEAYAFSPTDKEALIKMALIDVSVPFEERASAIRLRKSYKPWWYVVDSRTGGVKHEYRTNRLPKRWWIY